MVNKRAKAGGETVGGKWFKGGQFVTKEALAIQAEMDSGGLLSGLRKLEQKIKLGKFESLRKAAYGIMRDAKRSIRRRKNRTAAPVGSPAYQHRGGWRAAIAYAMERDGNDAVIGFRGSYVDKTAAVHEHGLEEEGRKYPVRPTMGPALERNIERFHRDWRGSIS
jgi:hypothetical protein